MENPEVFDILGSVDWQKLILQLTVYTINLAKCYHFPDKCIILPKGKSVEDLVFEAITKVFTGERKWNPDAVELKPFLKGVIKSLHSHLYDCPEYSRRDYHDPSDDDFFQVGAFLHLTSTETSEQQMYVEQFKEYLVQSAWDEISKQIIDCLLMEMNRKEIIEELELSPDAVSRYIRKIRIIAEEFLR